MIRSIVISLALLILGQVLSAQTAAEIQVGEWTRKGMAHIANANYQSAINVFQKAENLARKNGNCIGSLQIGEQIHYYSLHVLRQDITPIIRELKVSINQCDTAHVTVVKGLEHIGSYYFNRYALDSAYHYFEQARQMQIGLTGEQDLTVARLYYHLGNVFSYKYNTNGAASYFQLAYEIHQVLGEFPLYDYASLLFSMGNNYIYMGQYNQAELYLDEARPLYEKFYGKKTSNLGGLVHSMAIVQYSQHKMFAAKKLILEALDIYRQDEQAHKVAIAQLYDMLGRVYTLEQEYEQALFCYQGTEKRYKELYGEETEAFAEVYRNMATVYYELGDTSNASLYFKKALNIAYDKNLTMIIVDTYIEMGNLININYFQNALNLLLPNFKGQSIYDNPSLQDVKNGCRNYKKMLDLLNRKLDWLEDNREAQNDTFNYKLAKVTLDLVEKSDSICKYILSEHVSPNDQKEFLSLFGNIYNQSQKICWDLYALTNKEKYLDRGFYFSEQYKSFLLKDALKVGEALSFGGVPTEIRQQQQNIRKELASLKAELLELKANNDTINIPIKSKAILDLGNQLNTLKKQIEKDYAKYHKFKNGDAPISTSLVQEQLLDPNTVLLEYMVGDSATVLHVITKDKIQVYKTINQRSLSRKIKQLLLKLKNPLLSDLELFAKDASDLYKLLLKQPLSNLPEEVNKLIIIPDKDLVNLPFEILLTSDGGQPTLPYNKLPYLIRKYTVNYSYSAALLHENKKEKPIASAKILAMAASYDTSIITNTSRMPYIQKMRKTLDSLPYATAEIEYLERVYEGRFLYGEAANEQRFKQLADSFSIIHLALHGLTNKSMPMFSGLFFSENSDTLEDNMLFLHEISNLDLKTNMVVLSACETGIGRYAEGEGALSLARAFMYAGTPSIIMSLWSVNDLSTKVLMTTFYKQLSQGITKDEALRQAKLQYLDSQKGLAAHPALWAAFVHLGDTQSITIPKKISNMPLYLGIGGLLLAALILLGRWRLLANARKEV
ncbi:MAG: CHAT domain-containing protein [Aureispira sp.]|nr:CHAT domain-containing protein [Aureispira sp.]